MNAPCRIVMNTRTLDAGGSGVQRYALEISRLLGDRVDRLSPSSPSDGIKGHLWEQLALPRRCRERLLFSPGNTGPLSHRRQVVTIHDASTFDCPDAFSTKFRLWYQFLLPRLARRSAHIITVSEFSRQRLAARLRVPESHISVVHNGVSLPGIADATRQFRSDVRNKYGLPSRFLLFVGSLDPRKNLRMLLDAFSSTNASLGLVIAGGMNAAIFANALPPAAASRARFVGRVDDTTLDCLYSMADALIFPSSYEGFGLPPLEAMARGCLVLCSETTSLPEVCGPGFDQGGCCVYFRPDSAASIRAAIDLFSNIPSPARESMRQAGYVWANKFTWEKCAEKTLDILQAFSKAGATASANDPRITGPAVLDRI